MPDVKTKLLPTVVAIALLAPIPALAAFSCPATDPGGTADKPDLSAMPITDADPTVSRPVLSAIDAMRLKGDKSGVIIDRLVAAYCARIGAGPAADAAKADQVRRFARNLAGVVYDSAAGQEEDVIVDTPLPTALFDKVTQAAATAKVSPPAWIRTAVEQKLGTP